MHFFENPRHAQSMIAYIILTEYFWKFQCILGMLLTCPIEMVLTKHILLTLSTGAVTPHIEAMEIV